MIDLNKPGFLEMHLAMVVGGAIGAVNSERCAQKQKQMMADDEKRRADAQLKIYRDTHK